jgi:hypothetical protein
MCLYDWLKPDQWDVEGAHKGCCGYPELRSQAIRLAASVTPLGFDPG